MAEETKFISVGPPGRKHPIPIDGASGEEKAFAAEHGFSRTGFGGHTTEISKGEKKKNAVGTIISVV